MIWIFGGLAGCISTTVGMGGGQILVIALSAWAGPLNALTWTGPALLTGNLHRLWMFRRDVAWIQVFRFVLGAGPGAVIGGLIAGSVPTAWLSIGMATLALAAVGRQWIGTLTIPLAALTPGGLLVGGVAATAGGAGVLAAPLWRGTDVQGDAYVASMAAGAGAIHVARMVGYGATGLLEWQILGTSLGLAMSIVCGNAIGRQLRRWLSTERTRQLELGAVATCALLALGAAAFEVI